MLVKEKRIPITHYAKLARIKPQALYKRIKNCTEWKEAFYIRLEKFGTRQHIVVINSNLAPQ